MGELSAVISYLYAMSSRYLLVLIFVSLTSIYMAFFSPKWIVILPARTVPAGDGSNKNLLFAFFVKCFSPTPFHSTLLSGFSPVTGRFIRSAIPRIPSDIGGRDFPTLTWISNRFPDFYIFKVWRKADVKLQILTTQLQHVCGLGFFFNKSRSGLGSAPREHLSKHWIVSWLGVIYVGMDAHLRLSSSCTSTAWTSQWVWHPPTLITTYIYYKYKYYIYK